MSVAIALTVPLEQRFEIMRALVWQGADERIVAEWAQDLVEGVQPRDWVEQLTLAVQRLPITIDPPTRDVYQSALETLAKGGDCASKSILLAAALISVFRRAGIYLSVAIVWEHSGGAFDHVRLAVSTPFTPHVWTLVDSIGKGLGVRGVSWQPLWRQFVVL